MITLLDVDNSCLDMYRVCIIKAIEIDTMDILLNKTHLVYNISSSIAF